LGEPGREYLSVWGSAYSPAGSWQRRWRGTWAPLVDLMRDRVGGNGWWEGWWDAAFVGLAGRRLAHASVGFRELHPGWLDLTASITWEDGSRHVPEPVADLLEQLVIDLAGNYGATFARVEPAAGHATDLEDRSHRAALLAQALDESPTVLRGYSWVTFLPAGVVDRLGGLAALEEHTEFFKITRSGTGVVIRVTESPDRYDHAAWRQIFDLVRPALPPGEVVRLPPYLEEHVIPLIYTDEFEQL